MLFLRYTRGAEWKSNTTLAGRNCISARANCKAVALEGCGGGWVFTRLVYPARIRHVVIFSLRVHTQTCIDLTRKNKKGFLSRRCHFPLWASAASHCEINFDTHAPTTQMLKFPCGKVQRRYIASLWYEMHLARCCRGFIFCIVQTRVLLISSPGNCLLGKLDV